MPRTYHAKKRTVAPAPAPQRAALANRGPALIVTGAAPLIACLQWWAGECSVAGRALEKATCEDGWVGWEANGLEARLEGCGGGEVAARRRSLRRTEGEEHEEHDHDGGDGDVVGDERFRVVDSARRVDRGVLVERGDERGRRRADGERKSHDALLLPCCLWHDWPERETLLR